MDWVTAGQVISMVGGIGGFGSIIAFAAFYRVRIRKDKAEARLLEKQGDTESTKPLRDIIDELLEGKPEDKGEYTGNDTEPVVEDREAGTPGEGLTGTVGREGCLLNIFKKAGGVMPQVPTPQGGKCPAVEEYKQLTK